MFSQTFDHGPWPLEKTASNEHLVNLLNRIPAERLKLHLCNRIEEKGLTFNQRDFLDSVAEKWLDGLVGQELVENSTDEAIKSIVVKLLSELNDEEKEQLLEQMKAIVK